MSAIPIAAQQHQHLTHSKHHSTRRTLTDEDHQRHPAHDQRDNHIRNDTRHEHRQQADHREDGVELLVVLVVQLHPERERVEPAVLEEREAERDGELAARAAPERDAHERRGRPPRERVRVELALEEGLPRDVGDREHDADDQQRDDIYRPRVNVR